MGTSPYWKTQRGDRIIAIWMGKKTFTRWKNPLCQSWRSENNLYWPEISICQRVPKQEGLGRFQTKIWCKQQCFTNTSWAGTVYTLEQYSLRALYHTVYVKKVPDPLLVCGIGDIWRFWIISNGFQVTPLIINDQFSILQNPLRSPILQTSNW